MNGETKQCNMIIFARFCQYVNEYQSNWDLFDQAFTDAFNSEEYQSIAMTPFSLPLTRELPFPTLQDL